MLKKILSSLLITTVFAFASEKFVLDISGKGTALDYYSYTNTFPYSDSYENSNILNVLGGQIKGTYYFDRGSIFGTNTAIEGKVSMQSGNSDYDGSIINDPFNRIYDTTHNTILEGNLNVKEYIRIREGEFWMGAGLGYLDWKREMGTDQTVDLSTIYLEFNTGITVQVLNHFSYGIEFIYHYGIGNNVNIQATGYTGKENFNMDYHEYLIRFPITFKLNNTTDFYLMGETQRQYMTYKTPSNTEAETQNFNGYIGVKFHF